jgi:ubiquinone biosynthesis protein
MLYTLRLFQIIANVLIISLPKMIGILINPHQWHQEQLLIAGGESLRDLFEKLGPVYIKIGQFLSVRRDLLPEGLIAPLRQLQDRVYPVPDHLTKQMIESEYELSFDEIFDEFNWQPIGAGSIAQVYSARFKNSSEIVAIKIKRPGIDKIVDRDLQLIGWITELMQKHPTMQRIPIIQSMQFLCASISEQLDFHREQFNTSTFAKLLHSPHKLVVSHIINDSCRESILVMRFEQGLIKIDNPDIPEPVYQQSILILLRSLYKMIFTFGFIHCDFHPGNIFINSNDQLVILDFGMTARLPDCDRIHFRNFFLAIAQNNGLACADIILQTSLSRDEAFDEQEFVKEVKQLINQASKQKAGDFRVAEFVYQLFNIQRRYKICGTPSFTMALISLIQFEGLALHRFPSLDFQKEARLFFTSGLIESVHRNIIPSYQTA